LEELGHVKYLLRELAGWQGIAPVVTKRLRRQYRQRAEELEIALGVRPSLSPEEARALAQAILYVVGDSDK